MSDPIRCCVDYAPADPALRANPHLPAALLPLGAVSAAMLDSKRWKHGQVITVEFLGGTEAQRQSVLVAAAEWERHAYVRWVPAIHGSPGLCRVAFAPGSSWSVIGLDAMGIAFGQPTTNIGWDDDPGTVLHELGHFLGLIHEHQSPASTIPWDSGAVLRYFQGPPNYWSPDMIDRNVFGRYGEQGITNSEYDPHSIMHYWFDPRLLKPGTTGYPTGPNQRLSKRDADFIRSCYPFPPAMNEGLRVGGPKLKSVVKAGQRIAYPLEVAEPGWYRVETTGSTDVAIDLRNTVGRLLSDDNSGLGSNARLDAPLMPGTYTVEVRGGTRATAGKYAIGCRAIRPPKGAR